MLESTAGQIVSLTLVLLGSGLAATWLLKGRRRDTWRRFARDHGLSFVESPDGPRMSGQIKDRQIDISTDDASSDHDVGGVVVVHVSLKLKHVPTDMSVEGIPGPLGDIATQLDDHIRFDNAEFDRHVLVKGANEQLIRAYWTASRQNALLDLVESAPCDQILVKNGQLIAEMRDIVSNRQQLDVLLEMMLSRGPQLDGKPAGKDA